MKHTTDTITKELLSKHLYFQEGELYRTFKNSDLKHEMDDALLDDQVSIRVRTGAYPLDLCIRRVSAIMVLEDLSRMDAKEALNHHIETDFERWLRLFKKNNNLHVNNREHRLMSAAFDRRKEL
jgi:hypothetical protein